MARVCSLFPTPRIKKGSAGGGKKRRRRSGFARVVTRGAPQTRNKSCCSSPRPMRYLQKQSTVDREQQPYQSIKATNPQAPVPHDPRTNCLSPFLPRERGGAREARAPAQPRPQAQVLCCDATRDRPARHLSLARTSLRAGRAEREENPRGHSSVVVRSHAHFSFSSIPSLPTTTKTHPWS